MLLCEDSEGVEYYEHPYAHELDLWSPTEEFLKTKVEPIIPPAMEDTPITIVDSNDTLVTMVEDLAKCSEIAIDVEVCFWATGLFSHGQFVHHLEVGLGFFSFFG